MESRKSNFKLGRWHGKLSVSQSGRETKIQRYIFASGRIEVRESRKVKKLIRIFGYEVPLGSGASRVDSADLLGYDKNWDLYIIELKRGKNTQSFEEVFDEIDRYEAHITKSKDDLLHEFKKEYFLTEADAVHFNNIVKIMVAPKVFYTSKSNWRSYIKSAADKKIALCYIPDKIIKRLEGEMAHIDGTPIPFHILRK